jgi:phosphoserine aminotransferase
MSRVHNFNAGPASLPLAALELARDELIDFEGTGMSIIEHSHRGKDFDRVHNEALGLVRELMGVPSDYHVLFLQGGASQQFATIPMNLLHPGKSADYVLTGGWSEKALAEAQLVGKARCAGTTGVEENGTTVYRRIPKPSELDLDAEAAYLHMTSNNTLFGTQWHAFPETKAPLVCDMSSDIMWKPVDVSKFGLIYAGAQKNIGPSGLVLVIARPDLVAGGRKDIPKIFRYSTHAKENSLYNTPPTFSIYLVRNVLRVLKAQGGLAAVEAKNRAKGDLLYAAIDENPSFFRAPVEKDSRSYMNVVFRLPSVELEDKFVSEAKKAGLVGLKGHRITGGIRASIYNAVGLESVQALVAFMREFARAA